MGVHEDYRLEEEEKQLRKQGGIETFLNKKKIFLLLL